MLKKIAALATLLAFAGCNLNATDVARKSLNTAEQLRQIAEKSLDDLDAQKQGAIIAQAEKDGDIPAAREALQMWFKKRFDADVALSALKSAIVVGERVIAAIEAKAQNGDTLGPAMQAVQMALSAVMGILGQLGVHLVAPGVA